MLYLENEEIKITDEGMMFPEVKDLYAKDRRNSGKPYFKKCISYIYYAYKIDGEMRAMLPSKRKIKAAEMSEVSVDDMETDLKVIAVIKLYLQLQATPSQIMYENAKRRVEETINWLNSIPIKKTEKQKIKVSYDVPGKDEKESTYTTIEVDIDNSDEVHKAMKMANILADQLDELGKKIVKENLRKKAENGRLFDNMNMLTNGK